MDKTGTPTTEHSNRLACLQSDANTARSVMAKFRALYDRRDPVFSSVYEQAARDLEIAENALAAAERNGPPKPAVLPANVTRDAAAAAKRFDAALAELDTATGVMLEAAKQYGGDPDRWPGRRVLAPVLSAWILRVLERHELPQERTTDVRPRPLQERF